MFIPSFHAGFNELLFVSIALMLVEAFKIAYEMIAGDKENCM